MRVAAVQFRPHRSDAARTRANLGRLADDAARGSDLVVLPEMALTGYVFPHAAAARAVAEAADGSTLGLLAPIARRHGTWIVAGFPELDRDRLFNSALVIDPAGQLAFVYRKTLLYCEDERWATPGDSGYAVLDTDGGSFTVGICMDLNDDRFVDHIVSQGVDVVAFPTNWVMDDSGINLHTYWAWRLGPSHAALVAANTWGTDQHVRFTGCSAVLQQWTLLADLPPRGDGLLRAEPARDRRDT